MVLPWYLHGRRITSINACAKDTTGKSGVPLLYGNLPAFLQMGRILIHVPSDPSPSIQTNTSTNNRRGKGGKLKPTTSDLPLPPGPDNLLKWAKQFLPQLYAWAGSTDDPFCANGKMANVVEVIWQRVYPGTVLEDADKPVVLKVVSALY